MPLALTLALLTAGLILLVSVLPGDARIVRAVPRQLQKALHLLAYAALAALWSTALAPTGLGPLARGGVAAGLATALGALIEYVQRFRPGRYGTWADVALNAGGALLGAAAAGWV
jgi:VanZ family protein